MKEDVTPSSRTTEGLRNADGEAVSMTTSSTSETSPSPKDREKRGSSSSEDRSKRKKEEKLLLKMKKKRAKEEKKVKKMVKRMKKHLKKHLKKQLKKKQRQEAKDEDAAVAQDDDDTIGPAAHLPEASKVRAPMTEEEWDKQQSRVRRVLDPETGRYRLIKGRGEVLEECVSRERHLAINKRATQADGRSFQATLKEQLKKS